MRQRWPLFLIAAATASLLTALVRAQTSAAPARARPSAAPAAAAAYVGSAACQRSHEPEHESWSRTLHVQMTKPIAEARVEGDFRPGTKLQQNGRAYSMDMRGGRYFISVANGARPPE